MTDPEASSYDPPTVLAQLQRVNAYIEQRTQALAGLPVASTKDDIENCLATLPEDLPKDGLGLEETTTHLLETISPALMPGQAGPRCYGLVTGGVTPAAQLADQLVTSFDPVVQVHWPTKTASVALEDLAMRYVLSLLSLPFSIFTQNCFSTGATASNILGLSLGRDWTVARIKREQGEEGWSVPEDGFGGVEVDVFVADAHASVRKAAALTGIGRRNVIAMGDERAEREGRLVCFDLVKLEERLKENVRRARGAIVVTSFGEVNTGAINSDTPAVRSLCDAHHAWLHIDAAFAAFAILHPDFEPYKPHLALGDSITSDAHKWINVPYDCGLCFSRVRPFPSATPNARFLPVSLYNLTGPGASAPAYLASAASPGEEEEARKYPKLEASKKLPSPLFMNIENSRRFRALPVLASLLSLGHSGYTSLIARNISFARRVESFLRSHPAYDVLTPPPAPSLSTSASSFATDPFAFRISNLVLFAPSPRAPSRFLGASGGSVLLEALNESNEMFVTGTVWRGRAAVRLAVSNWGTEVEGLREGREWEVVRGVLERVMSEREGS
ncbi:hypothetical protein JCM11251_003491 [Rhodosporidiobolus azoricus]